MADIERVLQERHDRRERRRGTGASAATSCASCPYRGRTEERTAPRSERRRAAPAPDGVVLTLTDISALEQARAQLAQLSAIVESSDDAIISKTLDGIITSWNARRRAPLRLHGRRSDRPARELPVAGRAQGRDRRRPQQVRDGRPVERLETQRVRKDGSLVDVSVTFSPILDGVGRDRRHLRRSRATSRSWCAPRNEIAEREERIRLLLDSTAEAIYGIDLSGVCIFCNAACARLLGYDSPAALIGKQMHPLIHHTQAGRHAVPAEQSPIYEAMRHREGATSTTK